MSFLYVGREVIIIGKANQTMLWLVMLPLLTTLLATYLQNIVNFSTSHQSGIRIILSKRKRTWIENTSVGIRLANTVLV